MGLAGRNQLLATTDFPTGQSLGKQYFTAEQTAGTEHPLGKEPALKKRQLFFSPFLINLWHIINWLFSVSLLCITFLVVIPIPNQILFETALGRENKTACKWPKTLWKRFFWDKELLIKWQLSFRDRLALKHWFPTEMTKRVLWHTDAETETLQLNLANNSYGRCQWGFLVM